MAGGVADDLQSVRVFEDLVQISREITGEVAGLEMTIEEEEQGQAKPLAPVDFGASYRDGRRARFRSVSSAWTCDVHYDARGERT